MDINDGVSIMIKIFSAAFLAGATLMASGAFAQTSFPGGDDAESRAVQEAITKDLGGRVSVQTLDGVVYLHGRVGEDTAERAEAIARGVPNVGKVVDATRNDQFQG
jgi:hypothetical protein